MALHHLEVCKGDSKSFLIEFTEDDLPKNCTGWTVFFTVKTNYTDADVNALISRTDVVPAGADATAGKFYLNLTTAQTNKAVGKYWYDIKIKQSTNDRQTVITGEFRVNQTVTLRYS